jgi:phosphoribosylformylglycinamidine cyclo-ligase
MDRHAYAGAGVDVEAGERATARYRALARLGRGFYPELNLNDFGALISLPEQLDRPMMVASTDGVGTKTDIARRLGRYDTIGQDLVAMCADDVACHGAQPAYFMDYVAVGRLDEDRVAEIVRGISDACFEVACALVGGETAEHPGVMPDDAFDLAGFCVGFVERDEIVDAGGTRAGDVIVGLASSGLHSNGFSLIRKLVDEGKLPLTDELLTPTRLYARAVLDLARDLRSRKLRVGSYAHVTGGGIARNVARSLEPGLGARIHPDKWPMPGIFERVALAASMPGREMRATFNCGIGFTMVLPREAADRAIDFLDERGIEAWLIGEVVPDRELGGERYVEA